MAGLRANYRSTPSLVETVNQLFTPATAGESRFLIPGIEFHPSLPCATVPELEASDQVKAMHVFSFQKMNRQQGLEESALLAGTEIRRLLALGRQGQAHLNGRPLRPRDICVLVRRHDQAELMRNTLAQLGIDALASGGGSVLDSAEAADLHLVLAALARQPSPGCCVLP